MFGIDDALIGAVGGSLIGGLLTNSANKSINNQNLDAQKEANQNSIQWRVADAEKAFNYLIDEHASPQNESKESLACAA